MRKSTNPQIHQDKSKPKTDTETYQLGFPLGFEYNGDWVSLGRAGALAREHGGSILTGYFDPKSEIVKRSYSDGQRQADTE